MSKILSLVFVDNYEDIKDLLPTDTTITNDSSKEEIAEAIFQVYENAYAKIGVSRS